MTRAQASPPAGVFGHGDLAGSLILVLPLLLAYEIGVVFTSSMNGVDFVTRTMLAAVDHDRGDYLLVQLALLGAYLGLLLGARARGALEQGVFLPMLLESSIYALTLGSFIILVMQELFGFSLAADAVLALGRAGEALVISLGAGVHEELVFRLGLMSGSAWVLCYAGMRQPLAVALGATLAAILFSLAHHSGPYGEPFHADVFLYRALAGGVFAAIYYYRSLAHAVYTHFLYDVYVLSIQA